MSRDKWPAISTGPFVFRWAYFVGAFLRRVHYATLYASPPCVYTLRDAFVNFPCPPDKERNNRRKGRRTSTAVSLSFVSRLSPGRGPVPRAFLTAREGCTRRWSSCPTINFYTWFLLGNNGERNARAIVTYTYTCIRYWSGEKGSWKNYYRISLRQIYASFDRRRQLSVRFIFSFWIYDTICKDLRIKTSLNCFLELRKNSWQIFISIVSIFRETLW